MFQTDILEYEFDFYVYVHISIYLHCLEQKISSYLVIDN